MVRRYITDSNILREINDFRPGIWVNMVNPTLEECTLVANEFQVDITDIRAALDDEESSRVDVSNDYTMILFDIPSIEYRHKREAYTTLPLGLIFAADTLITICAEETPVLKYFTENAVKEFSTKKQIRFIYQIILRTCMLYQSYLRIVDRRRKEIEEHIGGDTEDVDLIDLHELESNLVYFDTSLRANKMVLERLVRYSKIKKYPEDQELLEDVTVSDRLEDFMLEALVTDAIEGLGEPGKTIFLRRFYREERVKDIAADLGMTPRAVESQLYRGKKRLKTMLQQGGLDYEAQ